MILDKLKSGDKFKLSGQVFTVTNKTQGYLIGCIDKMSQIHYFSRTQNVIKEDETDDINFFKSKLRDHLYTKRKLMSFAHKLEEKQHALYGIKSKSDNSFFGTPESKAEKIDRLSKQIEEISDKVKYFQYEYDIVNLFFSKLDEKTLKIVKSVYVYDNSTFNELVKTLNLNISGRALQYQIDNVIQNYLKKVL